MEAFFLAVFLGPLGLDQFYLGFFITGCLKLATLCGAMGACWLRGWWVVNLLAFTAFMWWVVDIVRIGSAPIYASEYRVAYDLPHWFYVSFTIGLFSLLGYLIFAVWTSAHNFNKAKHKLMMHEDQQHRSLMRETAAATNLMDKLGQPRLASYPLPVKIVDHGYGATAAEVPAAQGHELNPRVTWESYAQMRNSYAGAWGTWNQHNHYLASNLL